MHVLIVALDGCPINEISLPYDMLRQMSELKVDLVGYQDHQLVTQEGLEVCFNQVLQDFDHTHVVWLAGSTKNQAKDLIASPNYNHLKTLIKGADYTLASAEASMLLAYMGLAQGEALAVPARYKRKLKKLGVDYNPRPIALSDKFYTTCTLGESYNLVKSLIHNTLGHHAFVEGIQAKHYPEFETLYNQSLYEDWRKAEKVFAKHAKKPNKTTGKQAGVIYVYDQCNATDLGLLVTMVHHHPDWHLRIIGNQHTTLSVEGQGFNLKVPNALQQITRAYMLLIPGGPGLNNQLNNTYLMHWLSTIGPTTSRLLTIGNAEQLIGVSGLLTDIECYMDDQANLIDLKYMMAPSLNEATNVLLTLINQEDTKVASLVQRFYTVGKNPKVS